MLIFRYVLLRRRFFYVQKILIVQYIISVWLATHKVNNNLLVRDIYEAYYRFGIRIANEVKNLLFCYLYTRKKVMVIVLKRSRRCILAGTGKNIEELDLERLKLFLLNVQSFTRHNYHVRNHLLFQIIDFLSDRKKGSSYKQITVFVESKSVLYICTKRSRKLKEICSRFPASESFFTSDDKIHVG